MTITELQATIQSLAQKIEAPATTLPAFSSVDNHPYVEIDGSGQLYFMFKERGEEKERKVTSDPDTLLYWVFSSITFSMALDHSRKNKIKGQDNRRISFKKQIELLTTLNNAWGATRQTEQQEILRTNPFDDFAEKRASFTAALREQGIAPSDAWQQACNKYPL